MHPNGTYKILSVCRHVQWYPYKKKVLFKYFSVSYASRERAALCVCKLKLILLYLLLEILSRALYFVQKHLSLETKWLDMNFTEFLVLTLYCFTSWLSAVFPGPRAEHTPLRPQKRLTSSTPSLQWHSTWPQTQATQATKPLTHRPQTRPQRQVKLINSDVCSSYWCLQGCSNGVVSCFFR